jgi:hypothetical protein
MKQRGNQPASENKGKRWVWVALGAVLVLYALNVLRAKPVATFGVFLDDGLYFSAAKALAAGQGYILPSFPGHLTSIKYPVLYPLLLAGVWKLDPHFPQNMALGVGITVIFGCLALLLTFLMLRRWRGLGDWPALAIVLAVSLFSLFILQSATIGSDIPFMALMLGAAWLAERSLAIEPGAGAAFGSGLLVGMSVGLRSLGIPVAAGIGLLLLFRRKFRRLFWFCLAGLPLTFVWSWSSISALLGLSPSLASDDAVRSGWTQTVCYYSSYACVWKIHFPSLGAIWSTILLNASLIAPAPGFFLLYPLATRKTILDVLLVILMSGAAYVGLVRDGQREGWRPLYAIFPLYVLVLLAYPYNPYRFLLPFTPLLFAGVWMEFRHVGELIAGRLKPSGRKGERVKACVLGLGVLALAAIVAVNLGYAVPQEMRNLGIEHGVARADEQGAFAWLREHAAPDARIIAQEDGSTYLYTDRLSVPPIMGIVEGYYVTDPRYIRRDVGHLPDVAKHIGASYWLTTPYDYPLQTPADRDLLQRKQKKLLATAPVVYRSTDGRVVLYDTGCLWNTDARGCAPGETGGSTHRH